MGRRNGGFTCGLIAVDTIRMTTGDGQISPLRYRLCEGLRRGINVRMARYLLQRGPAVGVTKFYVAGDEMSRRERVRVRYDVNRGAESIAAEIQERKVHAAILFTNNHAATLISDGEGGLSVVMKTTCLDDGNIRPCTRRSAKRQIKEAWRDGGVIIVLPKVSKG